MIGSFRHNQIFVKKVDDIVNLFTWSNSLEKDFPQLPSDCIVLNDTIVSEPVGEDDMAFNHQATPYWKFGRWFYANTVHDYDENGGGQWVILKDSADGVTWNYIGMIAPHFSDDSPRGTIGSRQAYPSVFMELPSGFYLLISIVEFDGTYNNLATGIRQIFSDNTFGDFLWVHNGINENDRTIPAALSGYPTYAFASEDVIDEVTFWLKQGKNKPKIIFGWPEVNITFSEYIGGGTDLREPTTIQPYNYGEWLKVWRAAYGVNYNVVQNGTDESTQIISELPNGSGSTAKRFINISPEIIVSVGHTKDTSRTELGLCIHRKNNITGEYDVANGDAYSLTSISQSAPVYAGAEKFGGEQLPGISHFIANRFLGIGFSVSKETMYFKIVDIKKLL